VAKFHEATPFGSKVLVANTLHLKPIFDFFLKKSCEGIPVPDGGAIVRLSHFYVRVKIRGLEAEICFSKKWALGGYEFTSKSSKLLNQSLPYLYRTREESR